ncbi:MAG TPA: ATP-binding cassette domain-containing protein [Acidobacteriota bacterium]|jgi:ABC-2 type transport system ATP-binding protein
MNSPILELQHVCKAYGSFVAVDDLSVTVPRGSIFGLLGPNGAGKSTTIRMIMNIIAPDSGTILFHGRPWDDSLLDRTGYLPEERGLYKKMKITELLLFLAEIKGMQAKKAMPNILQWLERMDLASWKNHKVDQLSKGMQQKIQFIVCVVHEPDLLILDEPFAGLDPINVADLKDILLDLKKQGKTIILSTHRMDQAEVLCDSLCLINKSRKVLEGTLQGIRRRYAQNSVLLGVGEQAELYLRSHPGVQKLSRRDGDWEILLDSSVPPSLFLKDCVQHFDVGHFETPQASLDEIFIRSVQGDA